MELLLARSIPILLAAAVYPSLPSSSSSPASSSSSYSIPTTTNKEEEKEEKVVGVRLQHCRVFRSYQEQVHILLPHSNTPLQNRQMIESDPSRLPASVMHEDNRPERVVLVLETTSKKMYMVDLACSAFGVYRRDVGPPLNLSGFRGFPWPPLLIQPLRDEVATKLHNLAFVSCEFPLSLMDVFDDGKVVDKKRKKKKKKKSAVLVAPNVVPVTVVPVTETKELPPQPLSPPPLPVKCTRTSAPPTRRRMRPRVEPSSIKAAGESLFSASSSRSGASTLAQLLLGQGRGGQGETAFSLHVLEETCRRLDFTKASLLQNDTLSGAKKSKRRSSSDVLCAHHPPPPSSTPRPNVEMDYKKSSGTIITAAAAAAEDEGRNGQGPNCSSCGARSSGSSTRSSIGIENGSDGKSGVGGGGGEGRGRKPRRNGILQAAVLSLRNKSAAIRYLWQYVVPGRRL